MRPDIAKSNMASGSNTEVVSLHEAHEPGTSPDLSTTQVERQRESDKNRVFALVGAAISQFPIWGISFRPSY